MERQWPIVFGDYLPSSCLFSYHPPSSECTDGFCGTLEAGMLGLGLELGAGAWTMDKREERGRKEPEIGHPSEMQDFEKGRGLCLAFSSLGWGGGGKGGLLWGRLFWVLTFTFYLLVEFYVMLSQSGGRVCQRLVVRVCGPWFRYHLLQCLHRGLSEVCSGGFRRNRRMNMSIEIQNQWAAIIIPGAP